MQTTTQQLDLEAGCCAYVRRSSRAYILDDLLPTRKLEDGRIVSARVAGTIVTFRKITSAQTEYETPEGVYRGEGALVKEEVRDEELIWTRGSLDGFQKEYKAGVEWMRDLKTALNGFEMPSGRGGCWVVSQFLYYILHPNEKLDRVLRLEKKRMGWETGEGREPVAAIHVRHGDRARREAIKGPTCKSNSF